MRLRGIENILHILQLGRRGMWLVDQQGCFQRRSRRSRRSSLVARVAHRSPRVSPVARVARRSSPVARLPSLIAHVARVSRRPSLVARRSSLASLVSLVSSQVRSFDPLVSSSSSSSSTALSRHSRVRKIYVSIHIIVFGWSMHYGQHPIHRWLFAFRAFSLSPTTVSCSWQV